MAGWWMVAGCIRNNSFIFCGWHTSIRSSSLSPSSLYSWGEDGLLLLYSPNDILAIISWQIIYAQPRQQTHTRARGIVGPLIIMQPNVS